MPQIKRIIYFTAILVLAVVAYTKTFGDLIAKPFEQEVCWQLPVFGEQGVPHGALWKQETVREEHAPEGYHAAVAWMNVVTTWPCTEVSGPALAEVRAIRIIEKKADEERVVLNQVFDTEKRTGFSGALFQRQPFWFGPGEGKLSGGVASFTKNGLVINARQIPHNIYHGWSDPRIHIDNDAQYIVEAEVRVTGTARLQLGMDYWRDLESDYSGYDPNCQTSNNCEAWIGDWQGDTNGQFITLRSPKQFLQ